MLYSLGLPRLASSTRRTVIGETGRINGPNDSMSAMPTRHTLASHSKLAKRETITCQSQKLSVRPSCTEGMRVFGAMRTRLTTTKVCGYDVWYREVDEAAIDSNQAPNQERWHYPANFEGAVTGMGSKRSGAAKANANSDRWERSVLDLMSNNTALWLMCSSSARVSNELQLVGLDLSSSRCN